MILVDTSIWADHLRKEDPRLTALLDSKQILVHPFVIGELAMGYLKDRSLIVEYLSGISQAILVPQKQVLQLVSDESLFGLGVGFIDAHLLASVAVTPGALLWSRDKRLHKAAERLTLGYDPL